MAKARQMTRRRTRKSRPSKKDAVVCVRRTVVFTINKVAGDTGNYSRLFLSDLPGSSDIQSLYSEYKIRRVKLTYRLVNAPNNNAAFPTLYVAPQSYNFSSGTPSSVSEVLQFQGLQTYQFGPANLEHSIVVTPTVSIDVNNLVSNGMVVTAPWLSTATNNVPHALIVNWISRYNNAPDSSHTIEIELSAWIDCRKPR